MFKSKGGVITSALVTAQDHITQALDPKALDVYPLDAIEQARDVLEQVKRKPQAVKDVLDSIKSAQRLIEQADKGDTKGFAAWGLDHPLDLAFDHITQAQANIEQALTTGKQATGNQKGVKAA
jgi:hypothetical protein